MRKLSRYTSARKALLRNQVSELLWHGRIETTLEKAKEIRPLVEKTITLALNTADDVVKETVKKKNLKGEIVDVEIVKDGPKKLAAKRKIASFIKKIPLEREEDEKKSEYKARVKEDPNPLMKKIFTEYVEKYGPRKDEGKAGGYTRIIKTSTRRGDGAELAIIELI